MPVHAPILTGENMSKKLTIQEAEARFPDIVKGQVWVNNAFKYVFHCGEHGGYRQRFSDHEKHGCQKCSRIQGGILHSLSCTGGIQGAENRHPDLVKGQEWGGTHSLYQYKCLNLEAPHGIYQLRFDKRNQGRGCQKCAELRRRKLKSLTIEIAEKRCPDMIKGQPWVGNDNKYWFLCQKNHGQYYQTFAHHDQGKGCPRCSESGGELLITEILESLKVPFDRQFHIRECCDMRPLPFDFDIWIGNNPCLIEFQGEQHYRPFRWAGGWKKFKKQHKHDRIKKNFCRRNKIPLLIIPYWEKDIEGKIRRFLGIRKP